jgi:hypothetical protein
MAQLLDGDSVQSGSTLVDLFSVPSTQTVIEHSYWYAAHPANTIPSEGPYQFNVSAGPEYLQLGKNYLYMKLQITTPDNEPIKTTDAVAPINLLAKTFLKQVKVSINGKLAYDSGSMYAYRVFLETELNYDQNVKRDALKAALYEKDTSKNVTNPGFVARQNKFKDGAVVELMAPIHCDLFLTDRLMLSNTQIDLELHRNSDKFALISFKDPVPSYKLKVIDMVWYVKKMILAPSVHLAIETSLMKNAAKYPLRRVAMTKMQIGPGRQCTPFSSVFTGQIPRRIIIGFVDTINFFGNYATSPFVFEHNKITEIYVQAGGNNYPREPLKTDFDKNIYSRAYLHLLDTLGMENRSNNITMADFKTLSCLFAFDLTPDESDTECWELIKEGTTTVHATFAEPIKDPGLEMIVYAEFDNVAMLDRNRTVYFDYTV